MADSLVVAGFETLGGGVASTNPAFPGATFFLADPFDFGAPQPSAEIVANMILDGERTIGRRAANRTVSLPISIRAPSRIILDAAREQLMAAVDAEQWTMVYTRDDGLASPLPLVFDCQRAAATVVHYSIKRHHQLWTDLVLSFPAGPYGRSDKSVQVDFPAPLAGRPTPPSPVTIDNYSAVSGTQWTQSLIGPGPNSAHWDPSIAPANNPDGHLIYPTYTKTGLTLDLCQGTDSTFQATGTTTTYIVTSGAAQLSTVGDTFQLFTSGGSLKQAQIFTITNISQPVSGNVTVTFSPAASATTAATDHAKQTGPSKVPALTVYVGFGSSKYWIYWRNGVNVLFTFSLTDGTNTVSFSQLKFVKPSSQSQAPNWYQLRVPIPQTTAVNMRTITGYTLAAYQAGSPGPQMIWSDFYIDSLAAQAPATPLIALQRGQIHTLAGILGTARAPASWQFQQQGASANVTKTWVTPGSYLWQAPPGCTSVVTALVKGAGGDGAPFNNSFGGGGGGGGGSAVGTSVAVTPGNWYPITIGAPGVNGGNGGNSTFSGDSVTLTGNGGHGTTTATGGAGGAAGTGGFAGGAGGNGTNAVGGGGGGGGGAGGSAAPGGTGGNASGGTGGAGGAVVTGGGIGGKGGTFGFSNGLSPISGYGGGGAGSPAGGFGRRNYGTFSEGAVQLTFPQPPQAKTLIVHRPNYYAPDTLCPFVSMPTTDIPDGTTEYQVQPVFSGINARFDGTYTIYAINSAFNNPSASRNLFVTFKQYEVPNGTLIDSVSTATRTFVPNTDITNGIVNLGEVTLPNKWLAEENQGAVYTMTITDSNTSDDWFDVLILDTRGSTVVINSSVAYTNYYVDEPARGADIRVLGSQFDRTDAVSVTNQCQSISGGPLGVDPGGNPIVMVYAADGNGAPAVYMTYYPRWRVARNA